MSKNKVWLTEYRLWNAAHDCIDMSQEENRKKTLHFSLDKTSEGVSIDIFNDLSPYSFTTVDYGQTDGLGELIIKSRMPSIKCAMCDHRCRDAKCVNYWK